MRATVILRMRHAPVAAPLMRQSRVIPGAQRNMRAAIVYATPVMSRMPFYHRTARVAFEACPLPMRRHASRRCPRNIFAGSGRLPLPAAR